MNYAKHYHKLILRAKDRILDAYGERHHIIPRCLGGNNSKENIVTLTPEEHYVAHQLLVKMNVGHTGLAHAANLMSTRCSGNKVFGWMRRHMGHRWTSEQRAAMSQRNVGRKMRPEWRAALSASKKGVSLSAEHRQSISLGMRGNKFTLGYKHTPESRILMSLKGKGRKKPEGFGQKISAARKGVKNSPEARAKISVAASKRILVRCPTTGRLLTWHRQEATNGAA